MSTKLEKNSFHKKSQQANVQSKNAERLVKTKKVVQIDDNQIKNEVEKQSKTPRINEKSLTPIRFKTQQDQVEIKQNGSTINQKFKNFTREKKSYSLTQDFCQEKIRNQSKYQKTRQVTPTKNIGTNQFNTNRTSQKVQQTTINQKPTQQKSHYNQKNQIQQQKIEQKTKITQNIEKEKDSQLVVPKFDQFQQKIKQQQAHQPKELQKQRIQPSKKSSSSPPKICKNERYNSPNLQAQKLTVSSIVRPIFKDAKYYLTPLTHFLRQQYFPKTSPYKLQFSIEFSEQQQYFKQKFCDHFQASFSSVKKCSTLKQELAIKPIKFDPPKQPKLSKSQIKTIIFDLDETLIHCNDINNNPTDHEVIIYIPNEPPHNIRFNIRPNCIEMLQILSQFYELILFTASFQQYADKILEFIDPKMDIFSYRLYRENCVMLGDLLVKDLRIIEGRKLENMVLVDNSAHCYFLQPDNGIPIIPFEENKKDKELIFLTDYLIKCENHPNWLLQHKVNFRNSIHHECQSIDECIRRFI